ncbi:MAG: glycosyltransferase family 1 protein [Dehalococcoidia bacterium]|nr:glycosyltransferase family 1 protein [Dehalococcoidia bacterium]
MRVGIDGRYIQNHFPGIGRYTYNLVRALALVSPQDTFIVFYNPRLENTRFDIQRLAAPNVLLRLADVPTFSMQEQTKLPSLITKEKVAVFHSPYYIKPYRHRVPSVVTIHDVSPSLYPEYLPSVQARLVFEATTRLAIATSKVVIVDSYAARTDLIREYSVSPDKVRVVHLAADEFEDGQGRSELPSCLQGRRYVLYLGINKPHKNLVRLIQAWAKIDVPHKLVLAGKEDERYPEARQEVEALGLAGRVMFLGEVKEDEMPAVYRGAELFVFPSLYEGFGLPVLEAMKSGVPVIASQTSSLPEIVGDAGILVNPYDVNEMAMAIQFTLTNDSLREELRQKSLDQAQKFSWERTARETLQIYREAASGDDAGSSRLQGLLSSFGWHREPH